MSEEQNDDQPNLQNWRFEKLYPMVRIYVAIANQEHDLLTPEEVFQIIEDPAEFLREMLENGVINIYASDFHNSTKII